MSDDINLTKMTEQELIDLNHRVISRLKHVQQARRFQELARFNFGDTVSFTPECGHTVVGTIARLNQKTATVTGRDGRSWRVSPSLLSKVTDAERRNPQDSVVVSLSDHAKGRQR